jgi:hypothetical protein
VQTAPEGGGRKISPAEQVHELAKAAERSFFVE